MDALTWTQGSSPRRVMIVDDEDLVRASLADMVELSGYQVCGQAANGYEAARLIGSAHPDIVLMDIMMPTMDGVEALQIINATRPTCSLIISAYCSPGLLEQVTRAGAQGYLMKPFRPSDLVPAIETALAQFERSRLSTEIDRIEAFFERAWSQASAGSSIGRALEGALVEACGLIEETGYVLVVRQGARMRALSVRGVKGISPGQTLGPADGRLGVALQRQGICRSHLIGAPSDQAAVLSLQVALDDGVLGCLCLLAPEGYSFTRREECLLRAMVRGLSTFLFRVRESRPHAWNMWLDRRLGRAPVARRRR
ncbi:MAG TPA: response regulator [Armatimonadetes bacterium]|nr:response regulator [Armatimonadota bacterium]